MWGEENCTLRLKPDSLSDLEQEKSLTTFPKIAIIASAILASRETRK
jgi:hypothetical protein